MTLTDAGALVALADQRDPYHADAKRVAAGLPPAPLVTSWPCFTEAMHLLGRRSGIIGQHRLWELVEVGRLVVRDPTPPETPRMATLMRKYADLPMDLADASLVAAAEVMKHRKLFSFDGDFRIYRLADGSTLELMS